MIRKIIVLSVAAAFMLSPFGVINAQTTNAALSAQVQSLLDQIKNLQTQIETLRAAQQQVVQATQAIQGTLSLIRGLSQGMSGDDVSALQITLAADPSVYPEGLVTGYFGPLTAQAVKKFQKKFGIEQVGFVGPKTLKELNRELNRLAIVRTSDDDDDDDDGSSSSSSTTSAKWCIPPGHLIAPGWLKKNNSGVSSIVSVCSGTIPPGIAKKLPGWGSSTTTPTTTPPVVDTAAPVISGVFATSTTAVMTIIKWTTDENATSRVWYSTTSPVSIAGTINTGTNDLVNNHSVPLSDLATSTAYYYLVVSGDGSGNTATSSQYSFTTLSE
ncbi:MAG: hypothetical protein A2653_01490 [Candidatus Zambryskibacteria bacterium RIFCSPHIGHO2_01_FULL_43_25]|uniref:Peptidoglycan binding-like domain-containing protein n=1 Tax=Candidatus Zambryskibacteria bacterium RIFCSPLOWO2_01_FULL_45_21 TaxID=1802761 RepID=A0A1G2U3T4_9BACT|nr:MAG: hypothetical protein A2653_01490 [Candidatus Zambryskibacteria bacterium RIFCSPHIGHO2_01_FULL_43_25]OHB00373.1 MAG: hypothetical protein A3E94_01550 [Candidatus Zambryskibacteria bacterium RIFCSPHIGHO2_12_FULL_44_12b]OHB04168.1 MAG: hypothetical protein A3B14_02020 [Candidatus Zambryskibacteria bacterium RIFCSPLOWO2_01_FULL_45_21]